MFPHRIFADQNRYYFTDVVTGKDFLVGRNALTRCKHIYEYIVDYIRDNKMSPTLREIKQACDISSTSVVDYYLKKMERMGLLKKGENVSRGIVVAGMDITPPPNVVGLGDTRPTYEELLQALTDTQKILKESMPPKSTLKVPANIAGRNIVDVPRLTSLTIQAVRNQPDKNFTE